MQSFGILSFAMSLILLAGLGLFELVAARADVVHNCPYQVWCAIVEGYQPDDPTPQSDRPAVAWVNQAAGQLLTSYFGDYPQDTGIAMMCTRDPTATTPLVTQLEYAWEQSENQTYFDVSNVAGAPFVDEGFRMDVDDPEDPNLTLPSCHGAYCGPGDTNCNDMYEKSNDDFQGMRTCSDSVNIKLTLCSG
ncbi:uncharacterized protein Z520_05503 [Fonsecaea multimorphosa CBS 102226]|uniref:Ig-like domain-containing protein n=1 Tax=Fonsecaea multimorphosa CBS 102226 TaxID=1442371 RepID=A0A0D2JZU2_9EURO|nr:uncharacterized protein Z520_05503 [Fonsecaea multimorphosa CBS 102226]KIX99042.1 hypothetical protein Z520_05503 [Fonsecaea multimorphosa CBS 102226]OAL25307.1 hypothetical protein AYO22_05184 [Fonsecaea multimorphosa]